MITPKGYVHNGKYGVMVCANVVSESGAGGSMCARGPPLCPESNIRGPTCDRTLHSSLYYTQDLSSVKYSSNISEFMIVFLPTSKKGRGLTVLYTSVMYFTDFPPQSWNGIDICSFERVHGWGGPTITKSVV